MKTKNKNWDRLKMIKVCENEINKYDGVLDGMTETFYQYMEHMEDYLIDDISKKLIENKTEYGLENEKDYRIKNFIGYMTQKFNVEIKINLNDLRNEWNINTVWK